MNKHHLFMEVIWVTQEDSLKTSFVILLEACLKLQLFKLVQHVLYF